MKINSEIATSTGKYPWVFQICLPFCYGTQKKAFWLGTWASYRTGVSNTRLADCIRPMMWLDPACRAVLENVRSWPAWPQPGLPNAERKHASSLGSGVKLATPTQSPTQTRPPRSTTA
uniref:Uncharacterized protein n=1 Tax=Micrurus spixii TaxID=129469 RepID=A0A2D4M818_9SAUR